VGTEQAGSTHPTLVDVILRDAIASDDVSLASFGPGSGAPWLDEVVEIVDGLIAWRDDPVERSFDRRLVVADDGGRIVAVAVHERVEHERVAKGLGQPRASRSLTSLFKLMPSCAAERTSSR